MWFSIGMVELAFIVVSFAVTGLLAALRSAAWRWAMAVSASLTVAGLLTPADPLSAVLLGAVLFLFFLGGAQFGASRAVSAA